jgi:DNA (cytosine-5)-methyltransferase 1
MKKPKIRLFEAFAGIGSQYYALKRLKNFQIEIAGISEWDIKALHAYRKLHYPDIHDEVIDPKNLKLTKEYMESRIKDLH